MSAGLANPRLPRAAVLVTGTEVLSGRRTDRNGPWLADRLRHAGLELAEIVLVGDERAEIVRALRQLAASDLDLIVTSGGLGPTADDITVAAVAELHNAQLALDPALERRIAAIVEPLRARFPDVDASALAAGTAKQATVPAGAIVLDPVGTAPGLVLASASAPTTIVLPGPPRELQPMWATALATTPVRTVLERAHEPREGLLLLFGIPESEIAATLRAAAADGIEIDRLEITTCLHRGEIEVATRYSPHDQALYDRLVELVAARHPRALFSRDGATVDQQVASALVAARATVAVCESCTGGLLAARLTALPGSSRYFRGGIVAYSNDAKERCANVEHALIERHGAVSAEVAHALAIGACERLGADIGLGVTGVAGPGGGTPEKPVGLVWLSVARARDAQSGITRAMTLPGSRDDVRERATTVAMHLLRRLLATQRAHTQRTAASHAHTTASSEADAAPGDVAPADAAPGDVAPADAAPADAAPADAAPADAAPADAMRSVPPSVPTARRAAVDARHARRPGGG